MRVIVRMLFGSVASDYPTFRNFKNNGTMGPVEHSIENLAHRLFSINSEAATTGINRAGGSSISPSYSYMISYHDNACSIIKKFFK